jgi:DNA-3-methyladenine glycosylase II
MKARLLRHFKTKDPVIGLIVSQSDKYELADTPRTNAFEMLARSIASQQLSGAVARKIIERLIALHDGQFPAPAQIVTATPEALRAVGFSFAKIAALKDLAAHALDGRLPDDATLAAMEDETIIERCVAVRGIGRWTAQMLLMFHLGRQDVMPADDFGVRNGFRLAYGLKGLPRPKALLAYAERWKPHRSAGAWYLWRAVELHQQGKLPKRAGRAPRIELELPKKEASPKKVKSPARKKTPKIRRMAARKRPSSPRKRSRPG